MEDSIQVKYVTAHKLKLEGDKIPIPDGFRDAIFSSTGNFLVDFFNGEEGLGKAAILNPTMRVVGGLPHIIVFAYGGQDQDELLTIEWQ